MEYRVHMVNAGLDGTATVMAVLFAAAGTMGRIGSLVGDADQNAEWLKDGRYRQIG